MATGNNKKSTAIGKNGGNSAPKKTHTRPRNHKIARMSKGRPRGEATPVQFGTAVNKKPMMMGANTPNIISC